MHVSPLLESKKSQYNKKYDSSEMGFCCPAWESLDIQEVHTIHLHCHQ